MKKIIGKISFRSRILSILLIITMLLSGFSLILVQAIDEINQVSKKIKDNQIPEVVWLSHWEKELTIKEYMLKSYIESDFCCDFINAYEMYEDNYEKQLINDNGAVPKSIERFKLKNELLDFMIRNNVQGLIDFGDKEAAKSYINNHYIPELHKLRNEIISEREASNTLLNGLSGSISSIIKHSLWLLLILTIVAIGISIYASYMISASLTRPIEEMIDKVDEIAYGKYGLTINHFGQFELQHLTNSINQMSKRLKDSFNTIMNDKIYREQILNSLPVGIITIDHKNSDISFNTAAKNLLHTNEELVSKKLRNNVHQDNKSFWGILSSKEICQNVKVPYETQKGKNQLLVSQAELIDQHGEGIGRIFYFIDITETELLEKRIHQSEKLALVGEIAAGAAHEIRNPLAVIHGFLSLMERSLGDTDKNKFHLPLLMKELNRINMIIEEMLLLAKPGAPILKENNINTIVEEILPLIIHSSGSEEIEFTIDLKQEPVLVDSKQIKQVMYNLIRNSIDAMEGTGRITIQSQLQKEMYQIIISDNGPGIPAEIQKSIFEPFLTTKENGTGLGLTIVQRIIENHHGNIELVSTSQNGTSFLINLPISTNKRMAVIS